MLATLHAQMAGASPSDLALAADKWIDQVRGSQQQQVKTDGARGLRQPGA